eukprot:985802-Amphidinium_carterae.2
MLSFRLIQSFLPVSSEFRRACATSQLCGLLFKGARHPVGRFVVSFRLLASWHSPISRFKNIERDASVTF